MGTMGTYRTHHCQYHSYPGGMVRFGAMTDDPHPGPASTVADRLKWARIRAGYSSPRNAATVLGWVENTYKSHENGIRGKDGLKAHHVKRYARGFKINEEWLATGKGAPTGKTALDLSEEEIRLILLMRAAKGEAA